MTYLCDFTNGIDDLTQREQASRAMVLRALNVAGRFSVWGANSNPIIARTMDALIAGGYILVTPRDFPWSDVALTSKGVAVLEHEVAE